MQNLDRGDLKLVLKAIDRDVIEPLGRCSLSRSSS